MRPQSQKRLASPISSVRAQKDMKTMANKYSKWDIEAWVKPNDGIWITRWDKDRSYWFQSVTEETLYAMDGLTRTDEAIPLSQISLIEEVEQIYSYALALKQAGLEIPKNEWPSLLSSGQRVAVAGKRALRRRGRIALHDRIRKPLRNIQ